MMIEPSRGFIGFMKNRRVLRPPPPHRPAVDDRQRQDHDCADVDDPHQPSPGMPGADIEHGGSPLKDPHFSPEETNVLGERKVPDRGGQLCQIRDAFPPDLVFSVCMLKDNRTPARLSWRLATHSLSGRLLLLTILFVMTSVALIYFPSVARYHHELLQERINAAQLAILPFTEAPGEQFSEELRMQLLERAGAEAVILRGGGQHELFLVGPEPPAISAVYDAGETDLIEQIRDVVRCLFAPRNRIIRIDATTGDGMNIIVIANEEPIRAALFVFSTRVLVLSLFISLLTALLVFFSVYYILVRPMQRITSAMTAFRANPEDPERILHPSTRKDEIGTAERELSTMQHELYGFLQQKTRLAALGLAVAKIQHDLRNILSSAQIASDRLSTIEDPVGRASC